MILLKSVTQEGKSQQCDARCYNGKGKSCACICGGINHGVGQTKACTNIGHTYNEWKAKGVEIHPFLAYVQPELPLMDVQVQTATPTFSVQGWKLRRRHAGYIKQQLLEGFDS